MKNEDYKGQLVDKIDKLSLQIEKLNLTEYLELLRNPRRLLVINFIGGIARGLGMAIGFSVLGAFFLYFLQYLVILNLPVIGDFFAKLIKIIQEHM